MPGRVQELIGPTTGRAVVVARLQLADAVPGAARGASAPRPPSSVATSLLGRNQGSEFAIHTRQQGAHRRLRLEKRSLLGIEAGDSGAAVGLQTLERRPLGAQVLAGRDQLVGDGAIFAGSEGRVVVANGEVLTSALGQLL